MREKMILKEKYLLRLLLFALCFLLFNPIHSSDALEFNSSDLSITEGTSSTGYDSLNGIIIDSFADGTKIQRDPAQRINSISDTPGVLNGDHPFTGSVTKLFDVNELAIIPHTHDGAEMGYLIDDALSSPNPFQPMEAHSWSIDTPEYIIGVETGDFNADGYDEIIVVDDDGYVRIAEYKAGTVTQTSYNLNALESGNYANIAVANFNDDPGDEFVINCGERERLHIWDPWDDTTGTYFQPGSQGDSPSAGNGFMSVYYDSGLNRPIDIATSDINGNGIPDITTVGISGYYHVLEYDHIQNTWEEVGDWTVDAMPGFTLQIDEPRNKIGTGDVDGDIKPDIATINSKPVGGYVLNYISWITYTTNGMTELANETAFGANFILMQIGMGDIDGDGLSETVAVGLQYEGLLSNPIWETYIFDDKKARFQRIDHLVGNECPWVGEIFVFTDIDSDGADEIIFSSVYEELGDQTSIVDFNAETGVFLTLATFTTKTGYVAAGDFDNDGITCKYTGMHGKRVTPSIPLFVLAPPPAYKDINDEGSETSISTEDSTSTSHSDQFSVSAGIKFSYGNSFKLFQQGIDYKISVGVSYEFSKTWTTTKTTTHGVEYSTGNDDNYVVFHAVEYESYYYTVLSHPDSESIGSNVSIDVPIQSNIFKAPVKYYNKKNATTPIGPETFTHTVGKPGTYPTKQQAFILNPTYITLQPKAVSHGVGSDSISYTTGTEETISIEHSVSLEASVEFESEFGSSKVGLEFSFGIGYGHSSETTIGSSMAYEATVSDIEDESYFEQYNYDWGMFIQTIYRSDGSRFKLVHYYADGEFPPDADDPLGEVSQLFAENPVIAGVAAVVGIGAIFAIWKFLFRRK